MRTICIAAVIFCANIVFSAPAIIPDLSVTKMMETANTQDAGQSDEKLFTSEDVLSTKQAFLLSLALPGLGEFYDKSYIKAGVFFATEAAFWGGFGYYMSEYSKKEDAFQNYAEIHWNEPVWRLWYDSLYVYGELADTIILGIETLPNSHDQQYYEMIGKYDWFALGWDDVIEHPDSGTWVASTYEKAVNNAGNADEIHREITKYLGDNVASPHRDLYMTMRDDANDQYTIAKYFIGAVIINHVLSAFDAAWTAKRHNNKLYEGFTGIQEIELRPSIVMQNDKPMPKIELTIKW